MIRGTTPTHIFTTDIDLSEVEVLYVTYKQAGEIKVEKELSDLTVTSEQVEVRLSQEETLSFSESGKVLVQIRGRFADGTAVACRVIEASADRILKEGVI